MQDISFYARVAKSDTHHCYQHYSTPHTLLALNAATNLDDAQSPDHIRNDLKCVEWDVKPCSVQSGHCSSFSAFFPSRCFFLPSFSSPTMWPQLSFPSGVRIADFGTKIGGFERP